MPKPSRPTRQAGGVGLLPDVWNELTLKETSALNVITTCENQILDPRIRAIIYTSTFIDVSMCGRLPAQPAYAEHSPSSTSALNALDLAEVDEVGRLQPRVRRAARSPSSVCLTSGSSTRAKNVGGALAFGCVRGRTARISRSTASGMRRAGIFAASRAKLRAVAVVAAADHHEILRHRLRSDPADAALEPERRDVMLAAAVRAAADFDARAVGRGHRAPAARAGDPRASAPGRATASPRGGTTRRRGSWPRRRSSPASASPRPAAASRRYSWRTSRRHSPSGTAGSDRSSRARCRRRRRAPARRARASARW